MDKWNAKNPIPDGVKWVPDRPAEESLQRMECDPAFVKALSGATSFFVDMVYKGVKKRLLDDPDFWESIGREITDQVENAEVSEFQINDAVEAYYGFQIDLNTSFTGEDSLDISLDAGNTTAATTGVTEFDGNATADALKVDGVSYTFPVAGATVFVADNGDASALFTTACTYGGPTNTLDDCGNVNAGPTGGAVAAGASYDFGNGFATAVGFLSLIHI